MKKQLPEKTNHSRSAPTRPITPPSTRRKRRLRLRLRIPWLWVGLGLFATVIVALFLLFSAKSPIAAELSIKQAYSKYREGAFFLDVRTAEEWNEIRIPNTTWIPLEELSERLKEVPKEREIVVVCRSGNRSQKGRNILKQAGYINVTSMSGGIKSWLAEGHQVEEGAP